jgi:GT2 family glycosyltransferase
MNNYIYIFLPVHNRKNVTYRFISCLKSQTYENYHLLLIDDGSSDGTAEMVSRHIARLTVLKGIGEWWWTGSLQQGCNWLKERNVSPSDMVLIINDDTEFDPDFLKTAVSLLDRNSRTLILAQYYNRESQKAVETGITADWRKLTFEIARSPERINCLSTRGLFLRAGDLFETGCFYPRLLPHYASDYEFTMRALRKGMRLITDPTLKLWYDRKKTGYRHFGNDPFWVSVKKLFSIKAVANPFVLTVFIALSCPWRFKLISWLRVWKRTASQIVKFGLTSKHKPLQRE